MALVARLAGTGRAVSADSRPAGLEATFAALFEEFSAPIFNYVLRMVGDPDRAADITQDTFIKADRKSVV